MIYRMWLKFLAFFRVSDYAVCEMSKDMGDVDYHDYPDTEQPFHMVHLVCKRCGKRFVM